MRLRTYCALLCPGTRYLSVNANHPVTHGPDCPVTVHAVESTVGKGSTFTVWLPLMQPNAEPSNGQAPDPWLVSDDESSSNNNSYKDGMPVDTG